MEQDDYKFECQECAECCSGGHGFIFLSDNDISRIIKRLNLDFKSFLNQYCITVDCGSYKTISLKEKKKIKNGIKIYDCIFLHDRRCIIYEDRPEQCKTYPFWPGIVFNADSWKSEASCCPGINKGKSISREQVESFFLRSRLNIRFKINEKLNEGNIDGTSFLGCKGINSYTDDTCSNEKSDILDNSKSEN